MFVVLRWYYNERDRDSGPVFPELSGVFGPFVDHDEANAWIAKQDTWGGWGKYDFQIQGVIVVKGANHDEEPGRG